MWNCSFVSWLSRATDRKWESVETVLLSLIFSWTLLTVIKINPAETFKYNIRPVGCCRLAVAGSHAASYPDQSSSFKTEAASNPTWKLFSWSSNLNLSAGTAALSWWNVQFLVDSVSYSYSRMKSLHFSGCCSLSGLNRSCIYFPAELKHCRKLLKEQVEPRGSKSSTTG